MPSSYLADPALFLPSAVAPETIALNNQIAELTKDLVPWWELGAAEARAARRRGDGPFPVRPRSPQARPIEIPGPDGGPVTLRVIPPAASPSGVYLHIHGGGWVLGGSDEQDPSLERIAAATGMTCVSVEYRLAPEHPYPAALDDCEAAGLWLAEHAAAELGADLIAIGGESAGAHLSVTTMLRLRDRHAFIGFRMANLVFGCFDLSGTPSVRRAGVVPILGRPEVEHFLAVFLPPGADPADPAISPLYADLTGLPPALFTVGTADPLLDDTLFMASRWVAAGNEAELAIFPGGLHGFVGIPSALAEQALTRIDEFLVARQHFPAPPSAPPSAPRPAPPSAPGSAPPSAPPPAPPPASGA